MHFIICLPINRHPLHPCREIPLAVDCRLGPSCSSAAEAINAAIVADGAGALLPILGYICRGFQCLLCRAIASVWPLHTLYELQTQWTPNVSCNPPSSLWEYTGLNESLVNPLLVMTWSLHNHTIWPIWRSGFAVLYHSNSVLISI